MLSVRAAHYDTDLVSTSLSRQTADEQSVVVDRAADAEGAAGAQLQPVRLAHRSAGGRPRRVRHEAEAAVLSGELHHQTHLPAHQRIAVTHCFNQSINQREICRAPLYETSRSANSSQWYARSKSTLLSRLLNVLVSVMWWRSEGRVFQAAGPQ